MWKRVFRFSRYLIAFSLSFVLGVLTLWARRSQPAYAMSEAVARNVIKIGMDEREVVAALGVPPGDYRTANVICGGSVYLGLAGDSAPQGPPRYFKEWRFNKVEISVVFREGKVELINTCVPEWRKPPAVLEWFQSVLAGAGL